jgi:aminopeptidase N
VRDQNIGWNVAIPLPTLYYISRMKFSIGLLFIATVALHVSYGQQLTRQDTLRGTLTAERKWWDVLRYDVSVEPDYPSKTIRGSNVITFKVLSTGSTMQIDLQEPMHLDTARLDGENVRYERNGNVYLLYLNTPLAGGAQATLRLAYSGKPKEALNPPWDGGWIWARDRKNRPWMSVACQGLGASVWYPCKDHQSDEPDFGASLSMIVADTLVAVANGRLTAKTPTQNGKVAYRWSVKNPINNYNIIPYIGKYVHWGEVFAGEKGNLDCDYWVLDYELEAAKKQFTQVLPMLTCFEHWFGPYPFYEDGYKLVQSPHLGMEHQSAVAYGNKFGNGYLGRDLSDSGWGLKWDFIIVHESGHEWFGNNITSKDVADMWIHESFTNYSETLFTTCAYGVKAGDDYCIGSRRNIENAAPIIGIYGVNREGSGDMYPKGGSMIHNIRQLIADDEKFRMILRGMNEAFRHQTVTATDIEQYMSKKSGIDLSAIFKQYLTTTKIPNLEYKIEGKVTSYRWTNVVAGFAMKVKLENGTWLSPTSSWNTIKNQSALVPVPDRNFYITTSRIN